MKAMNRYLPHVLLVFFGVLAAGSIAQASVTSSVTICDATADNKLSEALDRLLKKSITLGKPVGVAITTIACNAETPSMRDAAARLADNIYTQLVSLGLTELERDIWAINADPAGYECANFKSATQVKLIFNHPHYPPVSTKP